MNGLHEFGIINNIFLNKKRLFFIGEIKTFVHNKQIAPDVIQPIKRHDYKV